MSFDQKTRNLLQRTVSACRKILDEEFALQRRSIYGINDDGTVAPLELLAHLPDEDMQTARLLRDRLEHLVTGLTGQGKKEADAREEAVGRLTRELAFTVLNRLSALRMAEERGIVLECVRQGLQSEGFLLFQQSSGGAFGDTFQTYRAYLFVLFDELAIDLGGLFSRWDPAGLLFPGQAALEAVLHELNGSGTAAARENLTPPEFNAIWGKDETIGWIYQYYNDPAERKKMRDESAAPRNSREMAVRNQFFTPRYVVEFLTDNSLGRLWYEMTRGRTSLKDRCRYLIRRPSEVFLGNPAVIACLQEAAPWVRQLVDSADFSRLPENPTITELSDLALLIDGYGEMERRGRAWEDFTETFCKPQAEAARATGEPWKGDVFELWCALFAYQREVLRNGYFSHDEPASEDEFLRHLWPALREALQHRPTDIPQNELLALTVFVPHRPLKDPREIRVIDPACGSMHFGLYAFDLLEAIYAEAWDLAQSGSVTDGADPSIAGFLTLIAEFSSKEDFLREVPRLIIEHNIHGIDIDPRATQIAGLSLWLRAQRAWADQGLPAEQRPVIRRSQIVCAEPMPGEKELLRQFVDHEFPPAERGVFLSLLESIFDLMQLAGEAGSLLQIDGDIRLTIAEAKRLWKEGPRVEQAALFGEESAAPRQEEMSLDVSGITDEEFWEKAEERIYDALRTFAESAGGSYQRRLFVDDAARGFAFIDLCRQRYDVALMNPPFGDASLPSKPYIEDTYGDTKGDVYKAFVECFHARLVPAGYLGIISSRTGFFLGQSEDWRTRVVLRLFRPIALADLGSGVLDAMVEVAAYVLRSLSAPEARDLTLSLVPALDNVVRDKQDRFSLPKWQAARGGLKRHQAIGELEHLEASGFVERSSGDTIRYSPLWREVKMVTQPPPPAFPPLVCVRALEETDKALTLFEGIRGGAARNTFVCYPSSFSALPGRTFAYWVSGHTLRLFQTLPPFESGGVIARRGVNSNDDIRFLRLWWEASADSRWVPHSKGGAFSRYYADLELVVDWLGEGAYLLAERVTTKTYAYAIVPSREHYFRPGLTWSRRSQRGLSVRALPSSAIFGDKGPAALFEGDPGDTLLAALAVTNSSAFAGLVALQMAFGSFEVGVIQRTPLPLMTGNLVGELRDLAFRAWAEKRAIDEAQSVSHAYLLPALFAAPGKSLVERANAWADRIRTSEETVTAIQAEIDDLAFRFYDLDAADRSALTSTLATEATDDAEANDDEEEDAAVADTPALVADMLAYALGCAFGRWDIRYATGERPAPPAPDPFGPLPVCPPGMLQNAAGLPAAPGDVPAGYPVGITWPGILVDDASRPEDIERRVGDALAVIFPGSTDTIVAEACALFGTKSLREWFRKPAGFFADHLKRYSKSRRQAPIYWPLSTASGSYTLWLYYHRLTPDTLYKCLQDHVEPKIKETGEEIHRLRTMLAGDEGGTKERRLLTDAEGLLDELRDLHAELSHWAPRWKPNLNDGVQITASPLWKLFRLPKWHKTLKDTWQKLEKGDYDWAHLALTLWPDRVREKCRTDRSLAIAHDLEDLCEIQAPVPKKRAAKKAAKKRAGQ